MPLTCVRLVLWVRVYVVLQKLIDILWVRFLHVFDELAQLSLEVLCLKQGLWVSHVVSCVSATRDALGLGWLNYLAV